MKIGNRKKMNLEVESIIYSIIQVYYLIQPNKLFQ